MSITLCSPAFQPSSAIGPRVASAEGEPHISPAFRQRIRFGHSRFRSPLVTGSQLISLPAGTQMFPSPAFAILADHRDALRQSRWVLTHSEIPGSKDACASPGLIAACHVLRRHPSQVIHHTASVHSDEYNIPADACANPMHGLIALPAVRARALALHIESTTRCCIFRELCFT